MRILQSFLLLLLLAGITSCRKYRIEQFGCKKDAFVEDSLFLPNFFTPNGDGNNDLLEFYHTSIPITNFSIKIRNALGVKVFESTDPDFRWAGQKESGRNVKLDVFNCEMCFDAAGKHYHHKSTVLLYWSGDPHKKPSNACPKNLDNCACGAQWNGTAYDPLLPTNEYIECD